VESSGSGGISDIRHASRKLFNKTEILYFMLAGRSSSQGGQMHVTLYFIGLGQTICICGHFRKFKQRISKWQDRID